ncbi:hypothetical protein MHC_02095 [Mycoplasma haemocanis str. Illinois]|uniref:Uncharacterized protein n=1 Tax=Mycoplasma haemocanis (strain Illinois) TaxID=1111676 RepID=H6N6L3_MYCHN|nr:hypothetical protein [Mycoplasma haemocanis]AEW45285.1 hypothetical protein MHC_02095 [Mycoplasma haemocanis str. Illinois]
MEGATIAKIAVISAGSLGVGAGGFYYSGILTPQKSSIKDLISKNKATKMILQEESDRWSKAWTKYKEANKDNDRDSWGLEGWKKTDNDGLSSVFKDKCLKESKVKISNENDPRYKNFVQWCTRTTEIQDQLIEEGYSPIPQSGQDEKWKANFDEYKKTENTKKIHSVSLDTGDSKDNTSHLNKLKNGCKSALEAPFNDQNYLNSLEGVKRWCTTKNSTV